MHPYCQLNIKFITHVSTATKAGSSSSSPGPSPAKPTQGSALSAQLCDLNHKDSLLREFRKLCALVAEKSSYNAKTEIIRDFLTKGSGGGEHGKIRANMNTNSLKSVFKSILFCSLLICLPHLYRQIPRRFVPDSEASPPRSG